MRDLVRAAGLLSFLIMGVAIGQSRDQLAAFAPDRNLLLVKDFEQMPLDQRLKIFSSSLQSAKFILSFDNADSMKSAPRQSMLTTCLIDRDAAWMRRAYEGYKLTRKVDGYEAAGAVMAKAIAWKCGFK